MSNIIVVDSSCRLSGEIVAGLDAELLDKLKKVCTHPNPAFATWKAFRRGRGHPPSQTVCTVKKGKKGALSFPRGRTDEILALLGPTFTVQDRRTVVGAPELEWFGPPARPYQERCIQTFLASDGWCAGVARAPSGAGKTNLLLELVSKLHLKTLVIVPTEQIFTQWVERCREMLHHEPGVIKGPKRIVGNVVTIGMQQTLANCAEKYKDEFGAVIGDEAQKFAAKTVREVVDTFPASFRCAVSQDERRSDGREFFIYDQFGQVVEDIGRDEVKNYGGIVDVEVVIVPTHFEANWYTKLPPDIKFEKRAELLQKMTEDDARTSIIERLVYGCDAESEQVMILTDRIEHQERITRLLANKCGNVSVFVGGDASELRRNKESFADGTNRYAVGTFKAVGVGFESHAALARGIFASPVASREGSRMQFMQYLGRYARPSVGKKRGRVYYLLDVRVFGKNPAKLIKKWVGPENTFVLLGGGMMPIAKWLKEKDVDDQANQASDDNSGFFGAF